MSQSTPAWCTISLTFTSQYKRLKKSSPQEIDDSKRAFLTSLLNVILEKLKWDETADPDDMDEDDKAAFENLRKVRQYC